MLASLRRGFQDLGARIVAGLLPGRQLAVQSGGCGFFGDVFIALNGIRFAELNGLACSIDWGPRSLYHEAAYGPNAWAYYFDDSSFDFRGESVDVVARSLPYRAGGHVFHPYDGLSVRQSVARAISRFCRPRAAISAEVQEFAAAGFVSNHMIGVHVRLTDAARGVENRRTLHLSHFIEATHNLLNEHPDAGIFLAADDQRTVERFQAEFGSRLVSRDCLRSHDGTSLHGHYDEGVEGSPWRKGAEVLIDALLLARCTHLVRSHSRVTCFSMCANPQLDATDLDQIHLGIARTPWLHDCA